MKILQQKHIIPTKIKSKPLFGSGIEKTLPYLMNDEFIVKAVKNGKVKNIDDKNKIVTLEYKDGSLDYIDLSEHLLKNGNGEKILKIVA